MRVMKDIWIRTDANSTIGLGHLSRCVALANMLEANFDVYFVILSKNKAFCDFFLQNWKVKWIANSKDVYNLLTKNIILITDSYAIDNEWRLKHQPRVHKLVDINDSPGKIEGVDMVINHSPGVTSCDFELEKHVELLLGLDYSILRPTFLEFARTPHKRLTNRGIFVSFGGADPFGIGLEAVNQLIKHGFRDDIYFITNKKGEEVDRLSSFPQILVLNGLTSEQMKQYMMKSKILFISSSILSFEAIALRKAVAAVYYVNNQKFIYEGLVKKELAHGCGYISDLNHVQLGVRKLLRLYSNDTALKKLEQECEIYIDGNSGTNILNKIVLLNG
jgi:spore coat polysaccharide biosynthesis predicted glycosyltransferase SpsG